jgi:hypothetical protein
LIIYFSVNPSPCHKHGEGEQRRSNDLKTKRSSVVSSAVLSRNELLYVDVSGSAAADLLIADKFFPRSTSSPELDIGLLAPKRRHRSSGIELW